MFITDKWYPHKNKPKYVNIRVLDRRNNHSSTGQFLTGTYGIHCLFHIIFCSSYYSYIYYMYIVIARIINNDYIVHLTSFFDNQNISLSITRIPTISLFFIQVR